MNRFVADLHIHSRFSRATSKALTPRRLAAWARANGKNLRPHIKTHKVPEIADLQLKAGAVGITCAKIGEAEIMIEKSKADDIFIAYQIVGAEKIARLLKLAANPLKIFRSGSGRRGKVSPSFAANGMKRGSRRIADVVG